MKTTILSSLVIILAAACLTGQSVTLVSAPNGGRSIPTIHRTAAGSSGIVGTSVATVGIQNGGFSSGLQGWSAQQFGGSVSPGSVAPVSGRARLLEGDSFLVSLSQTFQVPPAATTLSFDVLQVPGFDLSAQFIPDAFEVSLLDASMHSVVPTWSALATSVYNLQETGAVNHGSGVTITGTKVVVDVSGVPAGLVVTLYFDLIGGDSDTGSGVSVDNCRLQTPPHFDAPSPCAQTLFGGVGGPLAFGVAGSDLDPLDVLTLTVTGLPVWASLVSTGNNPLSGAFSGTPGFNDAGTYQLLFTVTDQGGLSAQCSVLIQINSSSPTFTPTSPCGQTISAMVGVPVSFAMTAVDPDLNDNLTLDVVGACVGPVFTPGLVANGNPATLTVNWTPAPGQSGPCVMSFRATDLSGHVITCSVTVNVSGSAPTFNAPVCGTTLSASVGVLVQVPITVVDPDLGDSVTLTATGMPSGATFVPPLSQLSGRTVSTTFRWTPPNQASNHLTTINLMASDLQGHHTTCSFSVFPAECYVIMGLAPAALPVVGTGGTDLLLVDLDGAIWVPVTLEDIPSWPIANVPFWQGRSVYSQVIMYNPQVFPSDPIKMSNGLHSTIGTGATTYGPATGMSHWTTMVPQVGQSYSIAFSIWGF